MNASRDWIRTAAACSACVMRRASQARSSANPLAHDPAPASPAQLSPGCPQVTWATASSTTSHAAACVMLAAALGQGAPHGGGVP